MASVFLSYDHEDAAPAAHIAAALENNGHCVWWDRRIHGGAEYNNVIETAVETADAVVVLWSDKSVRSPWVRDEAGEGRDAGKLVPVLIGAVKPPMGFRQFQTLDLSGWKGGKRIPRIADLLDAIAEVAGPRATAQQPAPAQSSAGKRPEPLNSPSQSAGVSRRAAIGGGAALAAIGAAGVGIWWSGSRTDPRVRAIIDQSEEALRHQTADEKTIRALQQAVSIDPNNPKALGLLALTKSIIEPPNPKNASAVVLDAERIAQRALGINPREPNALLAMFELEGSSLDWFTRDQRLRQILSIDSKNVTAISELVLLLQATGYCRESWDWNERAVALEPLSPDFLSKRALKLWILGRTSEADKVADQVRALYPSDPFAFFVRMHIYAFTGRPAAAKAMLDSNAAPARSPQVAAAWRTCLTALDQPSPPNIAKAREACIEATPYRHFLRATQSCS